MRRMPLPDFRAAASVFSVLCLLALPACDCSLFEFDHEEIQTTELPDDPSTSSHHIGIDAIEIPSWPPLGPDGEIHVRVSSDTFLDHMFVEFAHELRLTLSGYADEATVTGEELGEGFGTLTVTVWDIGDFGAERTATNVLVDLSPPKVEVPSTAVRGDGWLEVWVGDAWVLGSVELAFEGVTLVHAFPEVWPGTLGEQWDESIVYFETADLPAATGDAELTVSDAAGNRTVETFELIVDGKRPSVEIVEPAPGTEVSGAFMVAVTASDDITGACLIELSVGGATIARAMGPDAGMTLDAADFATGTLELVAAAVDGVGNRGTSDPVLVIVR